MAPTSLFAVNATSTRDEDDRQLMVKIHKSAPNKPVGVSFGSGSAAILQSVDPDSSAARAGLCAGDRILSISSRTPKSASEAAAFLAMFQGDITIQVARRPSLTKDPSDALSPASILQSL